MHYSVMLAESLEHLKLQPERVYLDATCGLGGHTGAIARQLTSGRLFSNDRDAESMAMARTATADCAERILFSQGPFSTIAARWRALGLPRVAGLLADLGVSRYQLTDAERGFSFQTDGPLDMRMDRSSGEPASDLVNFTAEKELADLIYQLGEERSSRQIARAIVRARPIRTTLHLAGVIERVVPRTGKIHPATQTFMALRLAVNGELDELQALLADLPALLEPSARVVFLTFMSTEDRIVKQHFQALAREGRATILTKHVIRPSEAEISNNPASRSAKLRAIEWK